MGENLENITNRLVRYFFMSVITVIAVGLTSYYFSNFFLGLGVAWFLILKVAEDTFE
ncbi:hypothetical protein KJ991_00925 [Patescibacteria group bacterium]|nr:hypothetical protein [Patescibacteria group bacterium]MBU4057797.1 hypothetical protein [Patescibacteria group bacterium]MBU4115973.1 hypothetical protein [Patescibacteria group bacterium]